MESRVRRTRSSPCYGSSIAYRVEITARAERDLTGIYAFVTGQAPRAGKLRFDRFEAMILSLSALPERCMIEPALSTPQRPVRKLLFGKRRHVYRVYFAIYGDVVRVLHVRHGARKEPRRI